MSTSIDVGGRLGRRWRRLSYRRIYNRFRDYTMVPKSSYVQNLELADAGVAVPGCVVECGVWRGGMSAGLAKVLGNSRTYYLFDSFAGLPPAQAIDGEKALRYQSEKSSPHYHDNCKAEQDFADRAMRLAGVRSFVCMKGWFHETLPTFAPRERIALLRLDGDWYESTILCLDHLYDRIEPGGLILIDDYYTWDGCSRAVHDFLSKRSAPEKLEQMGGLAFMRKH